MLPPSDASPAPEVLAPALHQQLDAIAQTRAELGRQIQAELVRTRQSGFVDLLRERAQAWPEHTALVFQGREWTYAELLQRMDRARQALRALGVGPGQAVAFLMGNNDHYVTWYLATLSLGAVAVPLNNRLVAREAAYILGHSRSVLLVSEQAFGTLAQQLCDDHGAALGLCMLDVAHPDSGLAATACTQAQATTAEMPAALYYTSGTTGQPKGVVHTHASLVAIALQSPSAWEYGFDGVRSLAITPLFHIAAHTIFYPVLLCGGTLVVNTYQSQDIFGLLQRQRITAFFAVPSILLLMVDNARRLGVVLEGVRTLMFGAAPMTISKLGEVQALFPRASLVHGMGQTESGGTLVTLPGEVAMACAGSVGLALPGVDVAIMDTKNQRVPAGQVGELVARGPNVMAGYFQNADATRDTLADGWLHTGDLGYQSANGLVTLVDRKKDMIIRGGENIYSCEVEEVLMGHPAVTAAAVVGQTDAIFGEQVAAFVSLDPAQGATDTEALAAHCRQALADYKVPVTFRFLESLPMTATGKIKKAELRLQLPAYTRVREAAAGSPTPPPTQTPGASGDTPHEG